MINDHPDPLKPPSELDPSIPVQTSMAIQQAMSINMIQRFATAQEFWQELNNNSSQQQVVTPFLKSQAPAQLLNLSKRDNKKTTTEQFNIVTRALADTPSSIDLLGFSDYAEALTDFIMNEETEKPLTIAIDAAWGMGKTSLMKMIRMKLEKRQDKTEKISTPIVWFDAWKYDQEGSLGAALVLEILDQIRKHFNLWQWTQFWWKLNWKRFDRELLFESILKSVATISALVLLGILGIVLFVLVSHWPGERGFEAAQKILLPVANILGIITIFTIGRKVYEQIALPFNLKIANYVHEPNYKERVGFLGQFEADFKLIVEAITKNGKNPLIVFIDDLDRCAPPKPVEIVEAINSLLDANYCVFVIGMDVQTVAVSIGAKYKDIQSQFDDGNNTNGLILGQRFLEKSVQINFHIPRVDEKMTESFIDKMHDILKENQPIKQLEGESQKIKTMDKAKQKATKSRSSFRVVQAANASIKAGLVQKVQKEKQDEFAQFIDKSEDVRHATHKVAAYLERNPRKIKRFINIFRLQALIANRRGLLENKVVQLDLLAKWMIIVTRWPSAVEAIIANQNFVKRLKEVNAIQEQLRESRQLGDELQESVERRRTQTKLDEFLEDPYIKRLINAPDLIKLVKQMTDIEIESISYYPYLTQSTTAIPEGKSIADIVIGQSNDESS